MNDKKTRFLCIYTKNFSLLPLKKNMASIIFEYIFFADPHFFYLIKINDNIFDEITRKKIIMYSSITEYFAVFT